MLDSLRAQEFEGASGPAKDAVETMVSMGVSYGDIASAMSREWFEMLTADSVVGFAHRIAMRHTAACMNYAQKRRRETDE